MSEEIKISLTLMVKCPMVPNFISKADSGTVSIADLSNEDLKVIGSNWTTNLLNRAEQIRRDRRNTKKVAP